MKSTGNLFPHHRLDVYRVALEMAAKANKLAKHIPRGYRSFADHLLRAAGNTVLLTAEGVKPDRSHRAAPAAPFRPARRRQKRRRPWARGTTVRGGLLRRPTQAGPPTSGLARGDCEARAGSILGPHLHPARTRSRARSSSTRWIPWLIPATTSPRRL